jgi:antitoxin component YwqK of YwqJK toxin-antitoxin module
MKSRKLIILLLATAFIFFYGCRKTIDSKQLQMRGDIAYEINSQTPFNGKVKGYWDDSKNNICIEENFENGLQEGTTIYYFENGKKHEEITYSKGKKLQSKEWNESGQVSSERAFSNDKLLKISDYYGNGQLHFQINNDNNLSVNKFVFYKENGEVEKTSYYLNKKIIPMNDIIGLFNSSTAEIIKTLGTVQPELVNGIMENYDYLYFSSDDGSKFTNKALVRYEFAKTSNQINQLGGELIYYNQSIEERQNIEIEMDKYFRENGYSKGEKDGSFRYEAKKLVVSKIINNTTVGYWFTIMKDDNKNNSSKKIGS